jgi:hypothetical protein
MALQLIAGPHRPGPTHLTSSDAGRKFGFMKVDRHTRLLLVASALILNVAIAFIALRASLGQFQVDAPQGWFAGTMVRTGHAVDLYDETAQEAFHSQTGTWAHYNRPAFHALLMAPLSLMPLGAYLWFVKCANLALYVTLVWLLPRWFPGVPLGRVWLISFKPFLFSVLLGQDTLLLTLIVAYGFKLMLEDRELRAGSILALAIFKPQIVWMIPVVLVAKRKWAALAGFASTAAALGLISFLMVGPHGAMEFLAVLQSWRTDTFVHGMGNARALATVMPGAAAFGLIAASVLAFAFCLWKRSFKQCLMAALFVGPMLAPHSFLQDFSPVAISALLAPPLLAYLPLTPWPQLWPFSSGVPFALAGCVFVFAMASGLADRRASAASEHSEARL